jgi:hypothetical protein
VDVLLEILVIDLLSIADIGDLLSCAPHLEEKFPLKVQPEEDCEMVLKQETNTIEATLERIYIQAAPQLPSKSLLSPHQSLPGDAHSLYSTQETSLSLPPEYNQVLKHASSIVGCLEVELADTVNAVEVALIKRLVSRRKSREMAEKRRRRDDLDNRRSSQPSSQAGGGGGREAEEMIPMSAI